MNIIELDKYVREELLAPLEREEESLPPDKQLALCLMALERIYTSYFIKSDRAGAKQFQKILEALENALTGDGAIDGEELDKLADWCEEYVDKWESGRFRGWKQYAVEILFPDHLSPFTDALEGICRQKNPFEHGDIYQIGVELCELYERDFQNRTKAAQQTVTEYIAARHEDVAAVRRMVLDTLKLYKAKKATQKDYFRALDELEKVCARYPEDKKRYWALQNGGPQGPEDMVLTRREAERVRDDILFLEQCGDIPNADLLERLESYRRLNILQSGSKRGKNMVNSKNILIIGDMPGYGKIGMAAVLPILSNMGHSVYNLPTALVSNNFDYGTFALMDTTQYIRETIQVWQSLGFQFDCITTGFLASADQAELLQSFIRSQRREGLLVVTDPIMGDGGKLYNGSTQETVDNMRRFIGASDVIVPNLTEAEFLTGLYLGRERLTKGEARQLLDGLRACGPRSVVVTSGREEESGRHVVWGFDHRTEEYFTVPYRFIKAHFPGTGDIFTSLLTGQLVKDRTLPQAVGKAVELLERLIFMEQDVAERNNGIRIEQYLSVLTE